MNKQLYCGLVAGLGLFNLATVTQVHACSALAGTEPTPLVARVNAADQVFAGKILQNEDGAAVIEASTYFKGQGDTTVRIADLYLNSCSTFPEVGSEVIFFVTEFDGKLIGQYDSIYGATIPLTEENRRALQNNAAIDSRLTRLGMDCAAAFDGSVLHVPCVKMEGSEALYMLNLALNANAENEGEVTLRVQDIVLLEEDVTPLPETEGETSEPSEKPAETLAQPAMLDSIEFMPAETNGQIMMVVQGHLRNGCERLQPLTLELKNDTGWTFSLTAEQPTGDVACTEALVPFTERTALDVSEMSDATYTVQVNQQTAELSLQNNMLVTNDNTNNGASSGLSEIPPEELAQPAFIESLDIMQTKSIPPQVTLVVKGYLRNGCESLRPLTLETQGEDGWTFTLQATQPAKEQGCTLALVEFDERVKLDTADLPSGHYQVTVNEQTVTFMLGNG